MPDSDPSNALPPGAQGRLTVPDVLRRLEVEVRVVDGRGRVSWRPGMAHGWNRDVVYVRWSDRDGYSHLDYFAAGDVRRL